MYSRSEAGRMGWEKTKDRHLAKWAKLASDYAANPRTCELCQLPIEYKKRSNRFCSSSCAQTVSNLKRGGRAKNLSPCLECGTMSRSPKYCRECYWKIGKYHVKDLGDAKTDRTRRQFLIRVRGHLCEVCKNKEWMGKAIPVELDHVDGNSDNNADKNLRLICPNCHAQTDTYKSKNRNKGSNRQKIRQKRYANGQTY